MSNLIKEIEYKNSGGLVQSYDIGANATNVLMANGTTVEAAVQSAYDKANIKKNTSSTSGDIIDSHLTIGTRDTTLSAGTQSIAVGRNNAAVEARTAAIGGFNHIAKSEASVVLGGYNNTTNEASSGILAGCGNTVNAGANLSVILGGEKNEMNGNHGVILGGSYNRANAYNAVTGRYNAEPAAGAASGTTGDAFIVGVGTSSARSNGFRVDYSGKGFFKNGSSTTGADYAELREWTDGNPDNEDRVGRFVAFDGRKMRYAVSGDNPASMGVVSGRPAVIGNNYADEWQGKYQTDIYGRFMTEHKSYPAQYDEDGILISRAYEADELILSGDYDETQEYIPREDRAEWDYMGTHGELVVIDDGSCAAGGFCMPNNEGQGIATAADSGFYVMDRIDSAHIRVFVR